MKIEFNTNPVGNTNAIQPAAKNTAAPSAGDSASLGNVEALKTAINNIPLVRPDKVDAARAAVSGNQYPSDQALNTLAAFLAKNIQ